MRKIKFKGFNTKKGFTREYQLSEMLVEKIENNGLDRLWLQYTGLKDKNGREIYEGDIVKIWSEIMPEWAEHKLLVEWWEGCAQFSLGRRDAREIVEIIGNIYENPELLK